MQPTLETWDQKMRRLASERVVLGIERDELRDPGCNRFHKLSVLIRRKEYEIKLHVQSVNLGP
jgi:hypothetical protein